MKTLVLWVSYLFMSDMLAQVCLAVTHQASPELWDNKKASHSQSLGLSLSQSQSEY